MWDFLTVCYFEYDEYNEYSKSHRGRKKNSQYGAARREALEAPAMGKEASLKGLA